VPNDDLELKTLRDTGDLDALRPEWDRLVGASRRPTPFLLYGWVETWLRYHENDAEPAIHLARRGGRLVAALPLVIRRSAGLKLASFVGDDVAFGDVLLDHGESIETARRLLAHAAESHDFAALHTISAESTLVEAAGRRLRLVTKVGAPVLDISRGFEHVYHDKTSSHTRRTHNRRRRQLSALGKLEFQLAKTPDELETALKDAFRLHAKRWQGQFDRSTLRTDSDRAFNLEALRALSVDGIARILTLRLDGEAIAFNYYFVFCERMFAYRVAYDPAYSRYSPGILNLLASIEQAEAEGVTTVELLRGEEQYKLELADRVEQLYEGVGIAGGPLGAVASRARVAALVARAQMKRSNTLHRLYLERVGPLFMRLRESKRS
jgi:CelD/BcsL family acetyltransferase involved in cellulose biosynthesis